MTSIDAPKSMDEFDVNVFDLTGQDLWKNKYNSCDTIDKISDFLSIQTMIEKSQRQRWLSYVHKILLIIIMDIHHHKGINDTIQAYR